MENLLHVCASERSPVKKIIYVLVLVNNAFYGSRIAQIWGGRHDRYSEERSQIYGQKTIRKIKMSPY
ncbi:hypothetical protein KHA80_21180 [Anaerobacillus sp. HL2]|nr:hypothetical protein KHA80_21180 [Anaerobacillus sp. HL2]